MTADWRRSIVRFFSAEGLGSPVGVGVLVGPDEILTCAHVVLAALGRPADWLGLDGVRLLERHGRPVEIECDFPHAHDDANRRRARLQTDGWYPVPLDDRALTPPQQRQQDLALLRITGPGQGAADGLAPTPPDAVVAQFASPTEGLEFRAWGVPKEAPAGDNVVGQLRGARRRGIVELGAERSDRGYYIDRGYSGGPVWVDALDAMVGIVVARQGTKAEMIPTEVLREVYPALRGAAPSTGGIGASPQSVCERLRRAAPMIDRLAQELEVRRQVEAIATAAGRTPASALHAVVPTRPVTFVVRGLEDDGVGEFKDKLQLEVLPLLFDRSPPDFSFQRVPGLDLATTRLDDLLRALENALGQAPRDAADLRRLINDSEREFFCFQSVISARRLDPRTTELIRDWLALWHEAGAIDTGFTKWTLVMIGVIDEERPPPASLWSRLWPAGGRSGAVDRLLAELAAGAGVELFAPFDLIEREDVRRWLDGPVARQDHLLAEQVRYALPDLVGRELEPTFRYGRFSLLLTCELAGLLHPGSGPDHGR